MQTILITAIGSASALASLQSLKRAGYRVIGCDIYPAAWNLTAGEVDAFFNVPMAADAQAYTDALLAAAKTYGFEAVIPLTDVEVDALCSRKAEFLAAGVTVCCPEQAVAELCRDKLRMAEMLGREGIAEVIPTYTAATIPADLAFPLMLKPLRGRSSQAQAVAHDAQTLMQALSRRQDYIIQPYLSGDVFTVDCARDRFGNTVTLTRRECLRTVIGLGTAVEICPNHPLDAVCSAILGRIGLVGAVNAEFICHEGAYRFLEVNPRFSGGVGFSALAGYDFTLAMLRCHTGEPLLPAPAFAPMTLAQRYEMGVTSV